MSITLHEAAGSLADLVDDRVGVIRSVSRMQRGAEEPSPPIIYRGSISHFDFRAATHQERGTAGKGLTEEHAIRAAIGEAVERYCGAHFDHTATFLADWSQVAEHAVAPPEFVLFSESQYAHGINWHKWDPSEAVTWLSIRELPGDTKVAAPASLIYLQVPDQRTEDAFAPCTSNGLAAGPNLQFAVLHGLYECIERDAFLITWMARLPAPEVVFSHRIRDHYRKFGTEVRVFRMCTDVQAHVMMAVALDQTGVGPAALVGLGCHASPKAALERALFEICQLHPGEVRRFGEHPPEQRLKRTEDIHSLDDHSAWLTIRSHLNELDFLLHNGRSEKLEDLPDYSRGSLASDLDHCVQSLTSVGCRVLYADLTTSDIRPYPIVVAKTAATGLQPIHFGYGEEHLGGKRLFELPKKLGFATHVLSESDLNPCPHPLA